MSRQATLIFDIGKTTKKVVLFDPDFHVIEEKTDTLVETIDDDGFPCEDIEALTQWTQEKISYYIQHPEFTITHINFSAYGASFVHIDKEGKPMKPLYNYLKPFPDDCKKVFKHRYDDGLLTTRTASPFLGLLNSGLQLFWLKKRKSDYYERIANTLHLPQFFTYLLTGKKFCDITSLGCHTLLWDYEKNDYADWVDSENLRDKFPSIVDADETTFIQIGKQIVKAGVGVHDSSAALMPYLATMKEPFLLLSTGTWNICFNPFNKELLTSEELGQDCLSFLTYNRKPVKASRIFLGHEHEVQQRALAAYFGVAQGLYAEVSFDETLYNKLQNTNSWEPFAPLGMTGSGPLLQNLPSTTQYSSFGNFDKAQHHLMRQLVVWQKISIDLVDPDCRVKNLIVVGGFTKSKLFLEMMNRLIPERNILISDHPRAAALGAAWLVCGPDAYEGKHGLLNVMPI